MKAIAYAIAASTCLALGCFAPSAADRFVMTGVGMFCLITIAFQKDAP